MLRSSEGDTSFSLGIFLCSQCVRVSLLPVEGAGPGVGAVPHPARPAQQQLVAEVRVDGREVRDARVDGRRVAVGVERRRHHQGIVRVVRTVAAAPVVSEAAARGAVLGAEDLVNAAEHTVALG